VNLPIAVVLVLGGLWVSRHMEKLGFEKENAELRWKLAATQVLQLGGVDSNSWAGLKPYEEDAPTQPRHRDAWREQVGSKVVEFALEKLGNSIVQQVSCLMRKQTETFRSSPPPSLAATHGASMAGN
jgi:hypothetical protein